MEKKMGSEVVIINGMKQLKNKIHELLGINVKDVMDLNDYTAIPMQIISIIANATNERKIQDAWKCISRDEDIEKSINELYNYVDNEERAFHISNAFRKIIMTNSRIAAAIIAYIIGEIKTDKRDFTSDDIILFNALERMTDFDIRYFKELMEENHDSFASGTKYFNIESSPDDKRIFYNELLEFGDKNRLFIKEITITAVQGNGFMKDSYAPKEVAFDLLDYIYKVNQILNYGFA